MKKKSWIKIFLAVTAGAIAMELIAIFDGSDNTVPWTTLIINYIPEWISLPLVGAFAAWLYFHLKKYYDLKNKKK